jgi:hypothetical protein
MAALNPGEGRGHARGPHQLARCHFVWVYNTLGPAGVGAIGSPFILAGVIWLVMRMIKPPIMLTLTPREFEATKGRKRRK